MKTIRVGPGLALSSGSRGVSINLLPGQRPRRLPPSRRAPFTLYDASMTAGSPPTTTLKVGITPGLVNLVSPTYTGASPAGTLAAVPPPLLTITATTYFWLKCVGTFGTPDTYVVTVESNTTGTVPAAEAITGTGFTSFLSLGSVAVTAGAITVVTSLVRADLYAESYGNINLWTATS